ncbi:MAG: type II secretion system inner membrane protein GspF [Candidatus Electrothrix sp. GW3-4]|uniref:type II secretion system inner membrane protein GspF n=1 Tax=Candidatus Electrothrix sp. GW3-4 TaxID=3126740 RepID=UPI0030CBBD46
MPVYEYTALNAQGKKQKGVLDADSISAARQKIRKDGSYPVEIKETVPRGRRGKKEAEKKNALSLQFGSRIKQQEIHVATRQLATLLGAGIPLVPALSGLVEQTSNKTLQTKITQIKDSVNEGNSLTSSLAEHPRLFSKIYVNMVQAGEASGSLDVVLERLAEVGERQQAMRSRIAAALIYPIFMALVGIGVLFLLITFIVPSITKVFTDRDQALPLPTTILISLSDFLQNYWIILAFLIIGLIIGIRFFIQQPKGQRIWDTLKLSFPVLKDLNIKIAAATLGRTMSSLLQSGVPLITSLQIVKNILDNVLLADVMDMAAEELEKGKSLSSVLRGNKYFTPMLVQMIAVGEQSGSLEKMLEKAADSYEKEVETKVMAMTSMIEPIMILVMGVAVSFIVISILLPIFEMNQLIK